jgi:hypothetical protein
MGRSGGWITVREEELSNHGSLHLDMKTPFIIFTLACALMITGCSTPESVATMQGQGTHRDFAQEYTPVWNATVAAAQMNDFYILDSDEATGFISARRYMSPTSFGQNVAIWVRPVTRVQTRVEVVIRRSGPPFADPQIWDQRIFRSISTLLPG